ncbi:hypothetical protein IGI37_003518 [Enterococcus sp. AZ194]|uniref:hypothetical protein n=1 Tax=Enterococcus sp. AZ194 TaxID=2774629 RepID=UPI003F271DA1
MRIKTVLSGLGIMMLSVLLLSACGGSTEKTAKTSKNLKVWSAKLQPATTISDWRQSPFHKGLEKETGITVDWEFPTEGTDEAQAFNLMTSESSLPDIIQYPMAQSAQMYLEDNVIKDLTDLLPEKAPNYWAFLKEHPDYDRAVKTDDGKYYSFGFFRDNVITATHLGPMLRKDWLDEQHLSEPKTIDDWENVMRVFNEKYGAKFAFTTGRMAPGFAGAFGAYGTFGTAGYVDNNNKIQLAQAQPEWKNYMEWLHKLFSEGLIDPDVVTLGDSDLKTKIQNDKVGITMTTAGTLTTYMEDAKASGKNAQWVGIEYPNQANGKKTAAIYYDQLVNGYGFQVGGTTEGKKLDKALEWLDWAFTDEGSRYWNFGTKDKSYELKDNQPEFTKEVTDNKLGTIEALKEYTGNVDLGLGVQSVKVVEARMDPAAMAASTKWYNENKQAIDTTIPKQVSYTSEESKELATITNTLDAYISENAMKFMTGERSLDEYDQFVKDLKDQGIDRYLEIRQTAYDRYLKR